MDQPSVVPEVSEETKLSRRRLLKIAAATGGAVAASTLIPSKWAKPVVDVGLLPAHAQISRVRIGEMTGTWEGQCVCDGELPGMILRVEFEICAPVDFEGEGAYPDEDGSFSGGTPGNECWKSDLFTNGDALAAAQEMECFPAEVDICVAFDDREQFTWTLYICEDGHCVSRSITVNRPIV